MAVIPPSYGSDMTTARLPHPRTAHRLLRSSPTPVEIEAWLDEVRPVLLALQRSGGSPSSGQQRWLAEQAQTAAAAIDALDCDTFAGDLAGSPCLELEWLHTRVCAALDVVHRLGQAHAAAA